MKTSKILAIGMIMLLLIAAVGCASSNNARPSASNSDSATSSATDKNTVTMQNFSFQPAELTINKGETVTWINQDPAKHDVVGSTFKSALFGKGASFSQTFSETGTFDYECSVHSGMVGKIIVK